MPFCPDEPYSVHISPLHPPIYEQKGHFFWADGMEIPLEKVKKILDYNPDFCRRYNVKLNEKKHRWLPHPRELR